MRKFLLTVLVVAGFCLLARPAVDSYWIRSYGGHLNDDAVSVQATSDGGAIAAGVGEYFIVSPIGHYNGRIWLLKTKPAGALQWRRDFELGGEHEEVGSVRQTSDGGYAVAGSTMLKLSGTLRYDTDPFLLSTAAAGAPSGDLSAGIGDERHSRRDPGALGIEPGAVDPVRRIRLGHRHLPQPPAGGGTRGGGARPAAADRRA